MKRKSNPKKYPITFGVYVSDYEEGYTSKNLYSEKGRAPPFLNG